MPECREHKASNLKLLHPKALNPLLGVSGKKSLFSGRWKVCIALGFAEFGLRRRQLRRGPRS